MACVTALNARCAYNFARFKKLLTFEVGESPLHIGPGCSCSDRTGSSSSCDQDQPPAITLRRTQHSISCFVGETGLYPVTTIETSGERFMVWLCDPAVGQLSLPEILAIKPGILLHHGLPKQRQITRGCECPALIRPSVWGPKVAVFHLQRPRRSIHQF